MHITDIHIYDPSTAPEGRVTNEDVLKYISQRLDKLFMREKRVPVPMGLDYSYWVEDEAFDLDYHVRFTKLPNPGIGISWLLKPDRSLKRRWTFPDPFGKSMSLRDWIRSKDFQRVVLRLCIKNITVSFDGGSATYLKSVMHTLEPEGVTDAGGGYRQTAETIRSNAFSI